MGKYDRRRTDHIPCHPEIARGNARDVILQAFHWNLVKTQGTGTMDGREKSWYAVLLDHVPRIAAMGVTVVYLPPPWRDDSSWSSDGKHGGGEGYFWHDFDLDSRYGTKEELTALVAALHARGIHSIVDLVVNHRNHQRMEADVWPYPGPAWAVGGNDTGGSFEKGAFDVALNHPDVQAAFLRAMVELTEECGVDGWRWDFVWGYGVDEVCALIRDTPKIEYLSVGEYWQGDVSRFDDRMIQRYGPDERARIVGWARDTGSCALDIRTKAAIQTGDVRNLRQGLCASRRAEDRRVSVTYVDNHDTGASPYSPANGWGQQHWPCPLGFKSKAYAFILSMPGTPMIYWPDAFDWGHGEEITQLLAARRAARIVANSDWVDLSDTYDGLCGLVHGVDQRPRLAFAIASSYPGPQEAGWREMVHAPGEYRIWVREPG